MLIHVTIKTHALHVNRNIFMKITIFSQKVSEICVILKICSNQFIISLTREQQDFIPASAFSQSWSVIFVDV